MNKKNIIHRSAIKPRINLIFYIVTLLAITQLFSPNYFSVYGQVLSDTDALIVTVNIERIRTQLWLTEQSLNQNNPEMAFAHAFIPHTDRKSTRLNSSHANISYAVFCLKKKTCVST